MVKRNVIVGAGAVIGVAWGILSTASLLAFAQQDSEEWSVIEATVRGDDGMYRDFAVYSLSRLSDSRSQGILLEALKSPSVGTRAAAANAFRSRSSASIVGDLMVAYAREKASSENGSVWVRMLLLEAAAKSGRADAADLISVGLRDPERLVRLSAFASLEKIGKPAVPVLVKELTSEDAENRVWAVRVLMGVEKTSSVHHLVKLLKDPAPQVRTEAAIALATLGSPAGDSILRELLRTGGADKARATLALAKRGDAQARQVILAELSGRDDLQRARAANVLGSIRAPETLSALRSAAERDPSTAVRIGAANSLVDTTGDEKALVGALEDRDEWVRVQAAKSLLERGDFAGKRVLVGALTSGNLDVRRVASEIADRFLTAEEGGLLEAVVRDENPHVKMNGIRAAGRLRVSSLLPEFKRILEAGTEHPEVFATTAAAVAEIGNAKAQDVLRAALKSERASVRVAAAVELLRLRQQ